MKTEGDGVSLIRVGNSNPRKLARVHPALIHGTHGVPTEDGTSLTRRLLSAPCFERTKMSGDEGIARQRALVGDPLDDEQWSEDLTSPSSH